MSVDLNSNSHYIYTVTEGNKLEKPLNMDTLRQLNAIESTKSISTLYDLTKITI